MNLPDRSTARNSTPSKDGAESAAGGQPQPVRIENMPMQERTVGPLTMRSERSAAEALAECYESSAVTHAAPLFVP